MKKFLSLLLSFLMLVSISIPTFAHSFTDITGHWAESAIDNAEKAGIVNGDGNGLFRPNDTVTRAEYVKMLMCTILPLYSKTPDDLAEMYSDSQSKHWCLRYYMAALDAQVFSQDMENTIATGDGIISPGVFSDDSADYKIERWEMAYMTFNMAYNLRQSDEALSFPSFADQASINTLPDAVQLGIGISGATGIIQGDDMGNFNPHKNGTRAEAVVMINRLAKIIEPILAARAEQEAKVKTYGADQISVNPKQFLFTMEDGSTFIVETYPKQAPQTVANFRWLVLQGYYNGLKFHRVTDQLVQGGDPNGDGTGGPDFTIKGEFFANGFQRNTLKHERGTISMARKSSSYNSAGSQFFICLEDMTELDGQYAAFGKVISGMENVDAFLDVARDKNELGEEAIPQVPIKIRSVKLLG